MTGGVGGWVSVERDPSEVFSPEALASMSGKPIVDDHPDDMIDPSNWSAHALGFVSNPRRGTGANSDCVVADLIFTTRSGIDLVRDGKRALSVGYNADYDQTQPGFARQKNIRANHVAIVSEGRCGPRCAIGDAASRPRARPQGLMRTRDAWTQPQPRNFGGSGADTPPVDPSDPTTGIIGAQKAGGPPGIEMVRRRAQVIAAADAKRSRAALVEINRRNREGWSGRGAR